MENDKNADKEVLFVKENRGCFLFTLILMMAAIGILAYFLGKKNADKTIDNITMNNVLVQQIAELASLEVQGSATVKSSNIHNDGSITDEIKKLFAERTISVTVPYVAKYGVDLQGQTINIEEKNKQVYIVLPEPKLLSYELRMDKADAASRKGLLAYTDEQTYNNIQKKMYTQSRTQLENYPVYIQQSKNKITEIIRSYYAPMNMNVNVVFKNDIKSKVQDIPHD